MTTDFVLAYVPRKMCALGVNDNYALVFREIVLKNKATLIIEATNQYYYLVGGFSNQYTITSESGVYNQLATDVNELQHEHTGKITIVNSASQNLLLQFVVVIPNSNKK